MSTIPKTLEDDFCKWLIKNMTLEQAQIIEGYGWTTQEQHCLHIAAWKILSKERARVSNELKGRYYTEISDPQRIVLGEK